MESPESFTDFDLSRLFPFCRNLGNLEVLLGIGDDEDEVCREFLLLDIVECFWKQNNNIIQHRIMAEEN